MLLRRNGGGAAPAGRLLSSKAQAKDSQASEQQIGGKSWVPQQDDELRRVTTQSLIHEVSMAQFSETANFVPWFLSSMPVSYFRQIDGKTQRQHMATIMTLRQLNDQTGIAFKTDRKSQAGHIENSTYIVRDPKVGLLNEQIKSLRVPENTVLSQVRVYSSLDNTWALNMFDFEPTSMQSAKATVKDGSRIMDYISALKAGGVKPPAEGLRVPSFKPELHSDAAMSDYLSRCKPNYPANADPRRFLNQRDMFEEIRGSDGTIVRIEPTAEGGAWVTIASANVLPQLALRLASDIFKTRGLDISRANLDTVSDAANSTKELPGFVTMLRLLLAPHPLISAASQAKPTPELESLLNDLKRSKWCDDKAVHFGLVRHPSLGLNKAEVVVTLSSFLHGALNKTNSHAYSSVPVILDMLSSSPHFMQLADQIASLFLARFDPQRPLAEDVFVERTEEIRKKIARLQFQEVRVLLLKMLEAVSHVQKTNFYHPDRYALALRFDPKSMLGNGGIGQDPKKPLPFGILFVCGRDFCAFHNRFRDIARGGLRVVTPPTSAQHALESTRVYDEVYGLSYAQQLKNKDIPEGGSKAVVLVESGADSSSEVRFNTVRKSIRAFTDGVLDLTVGSSCKNLVDLYGKEELIYLGPDEQVIPSDIDWITQRAAQRGYPIPSAFMSSKAGAGFNHKQYGVTSEGVVTMLETALNQTLGIDPRKQPFTVKVTGGPDGDVAGNLIKILFREFPQTCKVLAVSDGLGVCEDPEGLNPQELLRLVAQSVPIVHFDKSKLSSKGVCLSIETDDGLSRRNSMVFRIKSDAFVPAGGRPNTINGENWKQFLDAETGKPSSPLIVEGANIFLTSEARENLFSQGGVHIVKDSSANKCGVITSSYEVAASMLLSTEEFLSIKDEMVRDVLVRLRTLAKSEAELLFREYKNYPGALPHFSERISNAINIATDVMTDRMSTVNPGDPLWDELLPLVRENLPAKLAEVAWPRVLEGRFPTQYTRNAIASCLANKLVYAEGIHLVESQPTDRLADRMITYYREDRKIAALVAELESQGLANLSKEKVDAVKHLLRRGGTRTAMAVF